MIDRDVKDALVAQLDRALDYESRGREFESSRARHLFNDLQYLLSFVPTAGYRGGTDHLMLIDHIFA